MFSIVTVASSTRMPTASANPPSVMMFSVSPIADSMMIAPSTESGSGVGGVPETVQMLDFCAAHNVLPDVEMIAMKDVNTAFDRMEKGDVRYRFVIDMASLTT